MQAAAPSRPRRALAPALQLAAGAALVGTLLGASRAQAQTFTPLAPIAPGAIAGSSAGLTGKGQVGFVTSTGNEAASTANAKVDLTDVEGRWKTLLHAETLYAKSASVVSAERWLGTLESEYQLTKPLFVFGELMDTADKFSGFAYQASVTGGVGYNLIATHSNLLSVQVGAGYRALRPEALIDNAAGQVVYRVPGAATDSGIGTAALNAEHDFNATTKVTDKLLSEFGPGDTLLENDFALQVQMSRRLALSAGYSIQNNSAPPPGVKALETFTTLNLVFTLGR